MSDQKRQETLRGRRRARKTAPLNFVVTTEGEPSPVAILSAQLILLGVVPAKRLRMEARLRAELAEKGEQK